MSLRKMIQQDTTCDHDCQSKEKPGAEELPQAGIFKQVYTLHVLSAAVPEDKKCLDYPQDYTRDDEYRRPKAAILQFPDLNDQLQTTAE